MTRRWRVIAGYALCALLLGGARTAQAHKSSDSYLHLQADTGPVIQVQWDIALRDLDAVLSLDDDNDGLLRWGEVRRHEPDIRAYALARLRLARAGHECVPEMPRLSVDHHSDGAYAVLQFQSQCTAGATPLTVDYRLFADADAGHRGLVNAVLAGKPYSVVLGGSSSHVELGASSVGWWLRLGSYVREGTIHVWSGLDHLLFLMSLLLPAVVARRGRHWVPQPALRPAFVEVCKIVTAFTIAHSLTLTLASLGIVQLPSRLTESAIALSVAAAAASNLVPIWQVRGWVMAFAFGLVHGFGFASALRDLGLTGGVNATALLGFNLGVEAGQLAVVALFLPLAYGMRATLLYRRVVLAGGSACIALLGSLLLLERAFDWVLLPMH